VEDYGGGGEEGVGGWREVRLGCGRRGGKEVPRVRGGREAERRRGREAERRRGRGREAERQRGGEVERRREKQGEERRSMGEGLHQRSASNSSSAGTA
jgi:hypothetical protein